MLGVDVGTTSTKVVAFDAGGKPRARAEGEYPVSYTHLTLPTIYSV